MKPGIVHQLVHAFIQAKRANDTERQAEADSANKTANATVCIAFFTPFSIVAATLTVFILNNQLAEMKNERRPWVYVDQIKTTTNKRWLPNTGVEFEYQLKNTGKTGATTWVIARLQNVTHNWDFRAKWLCQNWQEERKPGEAADTASKEFQIFPGETLLLNYLTRPEFRHPSKDGPLIVGCVLYKMDGDAVIHQTPFSGTLYQGSCSDKGPTLAGHRFSPGDSLGPESLCVRDFRVIQAN